MSIRHEITRRGFLGTLGAGVAVSELASVAGRRSTKIPARRSRNQIVAMSKTRGRNRDGVGPARWLRLRRAKWRV